MRGFLGHPSSSQGRGRVGLVRLRMGGRTQGGGADWLWWDTGDEGRRRGGRKADKLVGTRGGFQDSLPKGGGISVLGSGCLH